MIVAVIPARGGSKRIPRKNILPFAGRPLIAWSIAAAKASPSISEVYVSTDDDEIAEGADRCGARVIRRLPELAGDDTPTLDVIQNALTVVDPEGAMVEAIVTLQPTNPLRSVEMIEEAITRFRSVPCDSLVSVSQRPLKTGRIENGYYVPSYKFGQQSRLTEPTTYENGLLYITSSQCLRAGSLCGKRILAYIIEPPYDAVDIDEPEDLSVGECIAKSVFGTLGYEF